MLLDKYVEVSVTARNFNHYKNLGYDIPMQYDEKTKSYKMIVGSKILVKFEDIPKNSHKEIKYQCDACGGIFETKVADWNKRKIFDDVTYCKNCAIKLLLPERLLEKYGVRNISKLPFVIEKQKKTNLDKYGVEWAIASDVVQEKVKKSFYEKYGVDNPMKNTDVQQKAKDTNIERYGGESPMCSKQVREKSRNTCMEKYGVPVSSQSKEIQAKARRTLNKNGTTPSSKTELKLYLMLCDMYGNDNCIHNFPEENLSLDCLVILGDVKIDIEYDGIYWHKERKPKDVARNAVLMNLGYRIIRIKGNNQDILPTKQQIQDAVNYLINENHHLIYIDMNK